MRLKSTISPPLLQLEAPSFTRLWMLHPRTSTKRPRIPRWPHHAVTMLYCILLITSKLLLPSVDGLSIDNPSTTPPTPSLPPSSTSHLHPPLTITEPPSTAALIPVYPRLFLPSTGKPPVEDSEGCTHTKRVPSRALLQADHPPPHAAAAAAHTITVTSHVNCKGCTAVTAIPMMQHTLGRGTPDPAGRRRAMATPTLSVSSMTATATATATATVYRCLATPRPASTASTVTVQAPANHVPPLPLPPRAVSSRRTRPVQPTFFAS
ncbi:hypothetical protein N658DRAFT_229886 [Parathielavia hyrcaniae]|uniref:Uncharacterized protein n=1 Tax=Parathielavia hyrcaniae TaxID=113614 RepID=A0AAN6SYK0_9PEZI|nr:hypothetical protein N658DRAFT_229886 [Parathielavia hyrcaniae]